MWRARLSRPTTVDTIANSVVVVGAGVIGLTTAVSLAEAGHQVTVLADEIPGPTSLAAGASWGPYQVEPHDRVSAWGAYSLKVLMALADEPGTGVRVVSGVEASRKAVARPDWAQHLSEVTPCARSELPAGFQVGWRYNVAVVDMPSYLDYLRGRLRTAGGLIEQHHVAELSEIAGQARAIVNCAGLGARDLTQDHSIYPIRGQLVVVRNPGIDSFFSEDTGSSRQLTHYLPHGETVVLGGTSVPHDWNREPDQATADSIIIRCAEIEPLLGSAQVLEHRVGLRPTRPRIRVEAERLGASLLIHNYGHGGAGVSLSWGCAAQIRMMASSSDADQSPSA